MLGSRVPMPSAMTRSSPFRTSTRMISQATQVLRERFKWVESEQQLPGLFQKTTTSIAVGYLGWSKSFGKFWS